MDTLKFYNITHREHVVCNPTSEEKLARLVSLLRLPEDARVVDIACGKGEFLIRLAEVYGIRGIGIDISPFCIADAQRQLEMRVPGAEVAFREIGVPPGRRTTDYGRMIPAREDPVCGRVDSVMSRS